LDRLVIDLLGLFVICILFLGFIAKPLQLVLLQHLESGVAVHEAAFEPLLVDEVDCLLDQALEFLRELSILLLWFFIIDSFKMLVGCLSLDHFQPFEDVTLLVDSN